MKKNLELRFAMFFLAVLMMISLVCAATSYSRANPNYGLFDSYTKDSSLQFDKQVCAEGQDFILQIAPFGCTPAVVRSDLLEEQNVPVFCQLAATKINPLIDVKAIESISFSGQHSQDIAGVGFHPAKAALGVREDLNNPVLNNIGYVVVVLKKQEVEANMPDFVSGNMTARIKYDIKNAFGIGDATFYLPLLEHSQWEEQKNQYSFWDGKGYLKAEEIETNGAVISVYNDINKISSVRLNKGETSDSVYLPGFDCLAGVKLQLNGLEKPDTRAKFEINGEIVEVIEGEKFLDNKCTLVDLKKEGLNQKVTINCKEDETDYFYGSKNFDLMIKPKIKLDFSGSNEEGYNVGDYLYDYRTSYGEELDKHLNPLKEDANQEIEDIKKSLADVKKATSELKKLADARIEQAEKKGSQVLTDIEREKFYTSDEVITLTNQINKDIDTLNNKISEHLFPVLDSIGNFLDSQAELYKEFYGRQAELYKDYYSPKIEEQKKIYSDYYSPSLIMLRRDAEGIGTDTNKLKEIISKPMAPVRKVDTPQLDQYSKDIDEAYKGIEKKVGGYSEKISDSYTSVKRELSNALSRLIDKQIEKFVYLGYVDTTDGSYNKDNLYVRFVAMPQKKDKLSNDEISNMARLDDYYSKESDVAGVGLIDESLDILKVFAGIGTNLYNWIVTGKNFGYLSYKDGIQEKFGKSIQIIGFAGTINSELTGDAKTNYDKSIKDYDDIINSYGGEKYSELIVYGELAFYEKMYLAYKLEQGKTVAELCEQFKKKYPESKISGVSLICDDNVKLSNSETSSTSVMINGEVKDISFEGIYEPDFKEYGATIVVRYPDGSSKELKLERNEMVYLNTVDNEFVQLVDLEDDSAYIKINLKPESILELIKKETISSSRKELKEKVTESFGSGYLFTLTKINLKKTAKVSVIPAIDNTGSTANFSFKIGIEKRAIQLSPEKTKEKIDSLNEKINKWEGKSESLGDIVKGLKGACLSAGAVLTVKNFFANIDGKAIARQNVMRGAEGFYEQCEKNVGDGKKYKSVEECLLDKSPEIDKQVDEMYQLITSQNNKLKLVDESCKIDTSWEFVTEKQINTDCFKDKYLGTSKDDLKKLSPVTCGSDNVEINSFVDGLKPEQVSSEELRDLALYASAGDSLSSIAKARSKSIICDIYARTKNSVAVDGFANQLGISSSDVNFVFRKDAKELLYTGKTYKDIKNKYPSLVKDLGDTAVPINDSTPVSTILTSDGKKYVAVLEKNGNQYAIKENGLYDINGVSVKDDELTKSVYFKSYDKSSYENKYENPEAKYYETEPYKGMPAVVPFDENKGWYAYLKQTVPVGSSIASYDASGRVSSFYLCNVGENKREEKIGGDDICQMINLGTGQPYNLFTGISNKEETSKIVRVAIEAVNDASRQYKKGVSKIRVRDLDGKYWYVKVGSPAIDLPDMQCQDFMSPTDCQWLFNLCDPVVCPSSRCDFGGAYPVKDVVQSGIVGSIMLCLPNWNKGIYVPVCLTGIKAGIDSLLSVYKSYRDCLQDSLDNGKMVGICDEINSIYLCDFFWRQGLPIANLVVPKMLEIVFQQNIRGGGEYLGVASAWETASNSVEYFTQYYAANSYKAFKARTIEGAGEEVCKNFASGVYASGGSLLDQLTEPDSPPQFSGRFDEIPFTTATVPPISQYKVFYHIYAGKDSRAYYQVYLREGSDSSYYQDVSTKRVVDSGYITVGEYASQTIDFTAPSGYKELCIRVNEQEECGFKQASTSYAVNYIQDQYLKDQLSSTDIKSEEECISGSASIYSVLNPNLQSAGEELINPEIYNSGIIRICATQNPGKGTDAKADAEGSRWVDIGKCSTDGKIRCWLDKDSVEKVIKNTETEKQILDELNKYNQQVLTNKEGYESDEKIEQEIENIKGKTDLNEKINSVNELIGNVFWNKHKTTLLIIRGDAYSELAVRAFNKIKAGEISVSPTAKPSTDETQSSGTNDQKNLEAETGIGVTTKTCQQEIGDKIIKIVQEIKNEKNIDDKKVNGDTGAKNFECLVLMQAVQESGLQHCSENKEGDCLYCNNDLDNVKKSLGDEKSYGVMQINKDVHKSVNVDNFEENVRFGINYLILNYAQTSKSYGCKGVNYAGWQRALRFYNGWNTDCSKGDMNYVENVLARKNKVISLFPECA